MKKEIVIGSRESELALVQTHSVKDQLQSLFPSLSFSINAMTTTGDQILSVPLSQVGGKALFTKELEIALEQGHVDFIVHSLKDVPTSLPDGMILGAILKREDPRDVVILHQKHVKNGITNIESLPVGSVIGTSSVRRRAQLKHSYKHLEFKDIRGNLNTRFKKLEDGGYDGMILAYAGIHRLGWTSKITQILNENEMLHAVGQGALGLECRSNDTQIMELLRKLNDEKSEIMCSAERAFMKCLEGGCSVPLGVFTTFEDGVLTMKGSVTSIDGNEQLVWQESKSVSNVEEARLVGVQVATVLLGKGADRILSQIKKPLQ